MTTHKRRLSYPDYRGLIPVFGCIPDGYGKPDQRWDQSSSVVWCCTRLSQDVKPE